MRQAKDKMGGQLISCVMKLMNDTTDETIGKIYKYLFREIMTVYADMLSKWIYSGFIDDRHGEFMVEAEEQGKGGEWNYWEDRFKIRNNQIPTILEKEAHTILVTGKYLNILKACNKTIIHPLFN